MERNFFLQLGRAIWRRRAPANFRRHTDKAKFSVLVCLPWVFSRYYNVSIHTGPPFWKCKEHFVLWPGHFDEPFLGENKHQQSGWVMLTSLFPSIHCQSLKMRPYSSSFVSDIFLRRRNKPRQFQKVDLSNIFVFLHIAKYWLFSLMTGFSDPVINSFCSIWSQEQCIKTTFHSSLSCFITSSESWTTVSRIELFACF